MKKIFFAVVAFAMLWSSTSFAGDGPTRIMFVGDSLTVGINGGYRSHIYERLQSDKLSTVFVGPYNDSQNSCTLNMSHAAKRSKRISWVHSNLKKWNDVYAPDVIVLMIGTNDIHATGGSGKPFDEMQDLIHMIYSNVDVGIVLILPVPMMVGLEGEVQEFNAKLDDYISHVHTYSLDEDSYKVSMLARESSVERKDLARDGVHLKLHSYSKIADQLYPRLKSFVEVQSLFRPTCKEGCRESSN